MRIAAIDQTKLAKTNQEYLDLLASDADWIARTADDVRQLRAANDGPLAKLSEADFNTFVGGLKFSGGGLGHATHSDQAAHKHTISLTVRGLKSPDDAARFFAHLLGDTRRTAEPIPFREQIRQDGDTFTADFPICCFFSETDPNESYYGVCRFGVPGPCGPEFPGCPA